MPSLTPLRRELLLSLGFLFAGATLLAAVALLVLLPVFGSPGEALAFVVTLLSADLVILFTINSNMGFRIKVARGIDDILKRHIPAQAPAGTD